MKIKPTLSLVILLAVIVLVLVFTSNKKTTLNQAKTRFSYNSFENINGIKIQTPELNIELVKQGNIWKTSNGETASGKKINTLFGAIKNLQVQSPVSKTLQKTLQDSLAKHAIRLTLLDEKREAYTLNFLNIKNKIIASKPNGKANGKAYYIEIKGYSHLLFDKVVYQEPSKWVDKLLMDFSSEQIVSVTVRFPQKEENGFEIMKQDGDVNLFDLNKTEIAHASPQIVLDYLHFFRGIKYETADLSTTLLKTGTPEFSLSISTTNKNLSINAYKLLHTETGQSDVNRFIGIINSTDTVLLKYSDFDPIVVNKEFFQ